MRFYVLRRPPEHGAEPHIIGEVVAYPDESGWDPVLDLNWSDSKPLTAAQVAMLPEGPDLFAAWLAFDDSRFEDAERRAFEDEQLQHDLLQAMTREERWRWLGGQGPPPPEP